LPEKLHLEPCREELIDLRDRDSSSFEKSEEAASSIDEVENVEKITEDGAPSNSFNSGSLCAFP